MEFTFKTGLTAESSVEVTYANSAATMGSGTLEVFATPAMIALMENAALKCVADNLPEGSETVGVAIDAKHNRATPVGVVVTATARLTGVEGRRLDFEITACDDLGEIGTAVHSRFIVDRERFLSKLKR